MRSTSVLLSICIITITLSCLVSFTQAEELRYRYKYTSFKRDTNATSAGQTTGFTGGGSYTTGGTNSTSGSLTSGGLSGNSTSNSTSSGSGQLTSGGTSGAGTTGAITSGVSTTGSATEITIVTFVITYRVQVDPATFDAVAAKKDLAVAFNVSISKLEIELKAVTKRDVEAVGSYELIVTIKATKGEDALANNTPEQMAAAANNTAARSALTSAGVASVASVGVTRTEETITVTTTGTTGGPDESDSDGLSAGAIAGIVIAVVAVVAIVVVAVVISKKRSKKHSQVQPLLNNNGPHYP